MIYNVDRHSFAEALMPLYPTLVRDARLQDMMRRIQADDEIAHQH